MNKAKNLKGLRFGKLIVIERAITPESDKEKRSWWKCKCECGNESIKRGKDLLNGKIKSCGCNQGHRVITPNKFIIDGDIAYIYIENKKDPIIIDAEDYDKVKMYRWQNDRNYARTQVIVDGNKKCFGIHNIILNNNDKSLEIDHINGNPSDNRKNNLRLTTHKQNCWNRGKYSSNTSGKTGVRINSRLKIWEAFIYVDNTYINLGFYKNKEDAINARIKAEKEYFGDYRRECL